MGFAAAFLFQRLILSEGQNQLKKGPILFADVDGGRSRPWETCCSSAANAILKSS